MSALLKPREKNSTELFLESHNGQLDYTARQFTIPARNVFTAFTEFSESLFQRTAQFHDAYSSEYDRIAFTGGTKEQMDDLVMGKLDMTSFHAARARLANTFSKIQTTMANIQPRRKRIMSEHDGEWNPDRKWEIKPFSGTQKVLGALPIVDLECRLAFPAGFKPAQIAEYGAFAWALSQAIEQAGFRVNLYATKELEAIDDGQKLNVKFNYPIKAANEYSEATNIARVFTPLFYRRGTLPMQALVSQAYGKYPCDTFGTPKSCEREARPGYIRIAPGSVEELHDVETLIEFVRKALV